MSKMLLKDMLKYLPAQVVPGLVGLASMPIVTRIFPPAEYGNYSLVMATVAILSMLFGWLPTSVIRYYPAYAREGRLDVFNTTIVKLAAITLAALACLYYAIVLLGRPWISARLWLLLLAGGLLLVATCAYNLLQWFLRSRRRVGWYSAFAVWHSLAGFGLGMTFIFLLGTGIEGLLVGGVLSIVAILPLLWREAVGGVRIRSGGIDSQAARAAFTYGMPLVAGNLASWVLALSDRYLLELFRNSAEVGVYSVSYNVADRSLMLLVTLFMMATGPIGMRLWEEAGERESSRFVASVSRLYLLACVPVVVGMSVLSRQVIGIMAGDDYAGGYRIMPYVICGILLLGIQQQFQWGLLYHKRTSFITLATVAAGVLNVLLNIVYVPAYGYLAAAVTTLVSYAVLLLLTIRLSRRFFFWPFPYRALLNAAIASGIMGIVIRSLERIPRLAPVTIVVICICAGTAAYGAALLLLGEFSSEELSLVRRAMHKAITRMQGITGMAGNR
jgi:O-antigen/teichoic acid export membrane protein